MGAGLVCVLFCVFTMAPIAEAQSPALSISPLPAATAKLSWPSNFAAWQLTSATNLSSTANWQSVTQTPALQGNALVVLYPITNKSRFFRLEQAGSCVFQATPTVIASGGSSTLTWCPVVGTTYRLSPGPGIVTGGSRSVSPTVTTVYTLSASNASGVTPSFATVIVNPCGFDSVSNWNGTLNFSYALTPPSPDYIFNVNRQAQLAFHLTRSMVSATNAEFTGYATGTASMNDRVDDLTQMPVTTITTVGSGPPLPDPNLPAVSQLILDIDCTSDTYSLTIVLQISATLTATGEAPFTEPSTVGTVTVIHRALPVASSTLSSSGLLPARGPLWAGGGDLYDPGDLIGDFMFISGVVTDTTAGSASVSWSIAPAP